VPDGGPVLKPVGLSSGVDYGAGDSDVVAVHAETIGYRVIDALREHGLTITRRR
jgi:hypothetical protein